MLSPRYAFYTRDEYLRIVRELEARGLNPRQARDEALRREAEERTAWEYSRDEWWDHHTPHDDYDWRD